MSATTAPSDKFAFLFKTSGSTEDLSGIKSTLKTWYGYPDTHIKESTGCTNLFTDFQTLPAPLSDVNPVPSGQVGLGETKRLTLFVFITGNANAAGLTDSGGSVSWDDLLTLAGGDIPGLPPVDFFNNQKVEVNFFVATPHVNAFINLWKTNSTVAFGTLLIPVTTGDALDGTGRQNFINQVSNLLQLQTGSTPDPATGMQSFNDIAKIIHPVATATYSASSGSETEYFPGRPLLLINDGPSPDYFESPDIKIKHTLAADSGYATGFETGYLKDNASTIRNKIEVTVVNNGTHALKTLNISIGIFLQSNTIPGTPDVLRTKVVATGLKPGETILPVSFDDIRLQSDLYNFIVACSSYADDNDFTDCSPQTRANEAQRSIAVITETLDFEMDQTPVNPAGSNNGTITINITGGIANYTCNCTGCAAQTVSQTCTFSNLSPGLKTITVTDSSSPALSCTKTTTIAEVQPSTCTNRLDNSYVNICRTDLGDLKFTFKVYPLPPFPSLFRLYKMRFQLTSLIPPDPFRPVPGEIERVNVTIISSGTELVNGVRYGYVNLRVPRNQVGHIIMHHPRSRWPFGRLILKINTEILIESRLNWFPLRRLLSVAKFKLLIFSNSLDIEI
jgi:hypothetical protein